MRDVSINRTIASDNRIDEVCDEFELAWASGARPQIEEYLDRAPDNERSSLFCELLLVEVQYRFSLRESASKGDYLARFSEFADQLEAIDFRKGFDAISPERRAEDVSVDHGTYRGARIAQFRLLQRAGAGAYGEVWMARDTLLHRTVALKVPRLDRLSESELQRFLREGQSAGQLSHPHIVRVFQVGRESDTAFIVSDWIAGKSLREVLAQTSMSCRDAAELCVKLADALHHAHEHGVIHRDLKPGNVIIDEFGEPHLSDFGLAKWRDETSDPSELTLEGQLLGTPAYMSPEQAKGEMARIDWRTDVYGLGVLLYEMLTGETPFRGTEAAVIHAIVCQTPIPPSKISSKHVPRDLETVCLKALEKDARRRYPTAQEMAVDLRRFLRGESIVARRASVVERSVKWIRRRPAIAASLLLAVLTLGSIAVAGKYAEQNRELIGLRTVVISTDPPNAEMTFIPLSESTGEPRPSQLVRGHSRSPVVEDLKPGDYLVVAVIDNQRFHEVYRHVPKTDESVPGAYNHQFWKEELGRVVLPTITIPERSIVDGMLYVEGSKDFHVGAAKSHIEPAHERRIRSFYIDAKEFSFADCEVLNQGHFPLSPGDGNHSLGTRLPTSFDHAVAYAEESGKRLPTEFELDYATAKRSAELNRNERVTIGSVNVGASSIGSTMRVDAGDWTTSWPNPFPPNAPSLNALSFARTDYRIVVHCKDTVGDVTNDSREPEPTHRQMVFRHSDDSVGFRCVRSKRPRVNPSDFVDDVTVASLAEMADSRDRRPEQPEYQDWTAVNTK
jgi:eukaryotic-like serine/threonine-protein kinase